MNTEKCTKRIIKSITTLCMDFIHCLANVHNFMVEEKESEKMKEFKRTRSYGPAV
jgi:hypothetical protein